MAAVPKAFPARITLGQGTGQFRRGNGRFQGVCAASDRNRRPPLALKKNIENPTDRDSRTFVMIQLLAAQKTVSEHGLSGCLDNRRCAAAYQLYQSPDVSMNLTRVKPVLWGWYLSRVTYYDKRERHDSIGKSTAFNKSNYPAIR